MGFALGHKRAWWSTFLFLGLVFLLMFVASGPGGVRAVRAQQADAGPAAAGGQGDEYEEPNLLEHIIKSAGWVFGPLLLLVSIALVTLIVILSMDLRLNASIPPDFVEEFTDTVNKRQFKQAFEMARNDSSFVARVLTAGMGRLQYGIEDAREAALNMTESVKAGKVRHDPEFHGPVHPGQNGRPKRAGRWYLPRPGRDPAGDRPVGAGHLLP
jgi:hypothetical protein